MDIIIFGGQSNMQGQSGALTDTAVVEKAYEYKWLTDELVPLKNPVGENITYDFKEGIAPDGTLTPPEWRAMNVTGSASRHCTNLVPSFCRVYTEMTGREVLAVHIAKGSTQIKDWLPETTGYEILVKKSNCAKEKVTADRILFVWLQGESDAIYEVKKDEYKDSLVLLNDSLKKDVGLQKFGIIRVGKYVNNEHDDEIISAQDEICTENPDFLMLTDIATKLNDIPEYMNPDAKGHFGPKGLEKLGFKAGKAFAEYFK